MHGFIVDERLRQSEMQGEAEDSTRGGRKPVFLVPFDPLNLFVLLFFSIDGGEFTCRIWILFYQIEKPSCHGSVLSSLCSNLARDTLQRINIIHTIKNSDKDPYTIGVLEMLLP